MKKKKQKKKSGLNKLKYDVHEFSLSLCLPDLSSSLSPQTMAQIKREIEKEREQLKTSKDMAEGEKKQNTN